VSPTKVALLRYRRNTTSSRLPPSSGAETALTCGYTALISPAKARAPGLFGDA
jgi:hypothetical protein